MNRVELLIVPTYPFGCLALHEGKQPMETPLSIARRGGKPAERNYDRRRRNGRENGAKKVTKISGLVWVAEYWMEVGG